MKENNCNNNTAVHEIVSNTDYLMQMLIDNYVDRDVKFVGIVREIPIDFDPTNRTEVLRVIDCGKEEKRLVRVLRPEHDVVFHMSAYSLKLSTRDNKENLLLHVPIHQVASVSYVNEDDLHIVGIKYGDFDYQKKQISDEPQTCHLAVLYCESKAVAEEICSMTDYFFQVAYTDATMRFFDKALVEKALTEASASCSFTSNKSNGSPSRLGLHSHKENGVLGFLSHSNLSLGNNGTLSTVASRSIVRSSVRPDSDDELSPAANELILDYMRKLYTKLNSEELQQFAMLVKAWHTDLPFPEFCNKVRDLYGPDRKHLLAEMRPFIPAKDSSFFECFIKGLGLKAMHTESAHPFFRPTPSVSMFSRNGSINSRLDYDDAVSDISNAVSQLNTRTDFE